MKLPVWAYPAIALLVLLLLSPITGALFDDAIDSAKDGGGPVALLELFRFLLTNPLGLLLDAIALALILWKR